MGNDIFTQPYWDDRVGRLATQEGINASFRSDIRALQAENATQGGNIVQNGTDIATVRATVSAMQSAVTTLQTGLSSVNGRVDDVQTSTAKQLQDMSNTLAAFKTLLDGYTGQIVSANQTATQAQADVLAIKTFADPVLIKSFMDKVDGLSANIGNMVKADFLDLWTPEKADLIARMNALIESVSAMDTRVSKNTQDIAAAQTDWCAKLADAENRWRVMARSIQGGLDIEEKARCATDKALQAQINNLCNATEKSLSDLTDTVDANKKEAAGDLDAAVKLLTDRAGVDEKALSDFQASQAQIDATQNGAIETNRKNIADLKTQVDGFGDRITKAESDSTQAASDAASALKTATDAGTKVDGFDKRITTVEGDTQQIFQGLPYLQQDVSNVKNQVGELGNTVAGVQGDVATVKAEAETNTADVQNLKDSSASLANKTKNLDDNGNYTGVIADRYVVYGDPATPIGENHNGAWVDIGGLTPAPSLDDSKDAQYCLILTNLNGSPVNFICSGTTYALPANTALAVARSSSGVFSSFKLSSNYQTGINV